MTQADDIGVLLVNDDPGVMFALRSVLTDLDASVETATSGEQALLRLLKRDFVVIILDVKMAGLDGFETARLIRQRPRSKFTPIIFLTSHRATDLDRATGYELGAIDYLFMPVAPEVLKSKVQVFIDVAKSHLQQDLKDVELEYLNQALQRELAHVNRLNEALRSEVAARQQAESVAQCSQTERLIVQHAGDYVALLDAAAGWIYASPSYQTEFGTAIQSGAAYFEIVHADDRDHVQSVFDQLLAGEGPLRLQYRVPLPSRGERCFESEASLIRETSGAVTQVVMVSRDITERKEMEAYILHQSFHDALTGLPNRLLLEDRMKQATARQDRQRAPVAVLFIDLDRFKDVNDTLGHAAGDRLLQEVAERVGNCVRDGDTVARIGGDEFVVLLVGLHEVADAALVADKIVAAISASCLIDGKELHITASIGIAVFPEDGQNIDALLRSADSAMYHAKQEGSGRFSFFTPHMQAAASRRLAIGSALQRAIAQREFILHYQPKVSAVTGAICGFEALIRWPQADGTWLAPSQFIPVAEETGCIDLIGKWALHEAAMQIRLWHQQGIDGIPIAVNVSALQFHQDSVIQHIVSILRESGIAPAMLETELTESAVMNDPAQAILTLHQIHDLGLTIAIDDFGTGYSSLAYLKRFPIDKLKIDTSFVRDIATDASDAAIVVAIITLAHVLNLTVIAEGVETVGQMAFLIDHGCDELQGHYFSKSVPHEEALRLLKCGPFSLAH